MGLFTTQTKRTYHKPRQRVGHSTTLKAKTRLKRWAKRRTKKLWRTTKQRIRRRWRKYQRQRQRRLTTHNRAIARTTVHTTGNYQPTADGGVSYQPGPTQAGAARLPPPDGAIAACRRCHNEVIYSAGHGRWEHPGHGHYECFQPHRT